MKNRKNRKLMLTVAVAALLAGWYVQPAPAANIVVTNVALYYRDAEAGQRFVKFDVSWDRSWRASWTDAGGTSTNWDAAWIFVKYRPAGSASGWSHASLSTNNSEHTSPAGSTLNVGLSANAGGTNFGAGVFLYRSATNSGSWTNTGVKLRWRYADDGVAADARVDVGVHAIEMVYVAAGSFYVGDGSTNNPPWPGDRITGQFEDGTNGTPFLITNESYTITLGGGGAGSLGNHDRVGMNTDYAVDDFSYTNSQTLPAAFPKGYAAFYLMKTDASQRQYCDFLNTLAYIQQTNRVDYTNLHFNTARNFIKFTSATPAFFGSDANNNAGPSNAVTDVNLLNEANDGEWVGCNNLKWTDMAAYLDWAALRPMTEMEYEKACRGPLAAVSNEFAWGTAVKYDAIQTLVNTNTASEAPNRGNLNDWVTGLGPWRAGCYANATSVRTNAGAGYYGALDLSGGLNKQTVSVGSAKGRSFTGAHGDGSLSATNGNANVAFWPGTNTSGEVVNQAGAGWRGGEWNNIPGNCRISDRHFADTQYYAGWVHWWSKGCGARGARTAP